MLAVPLIPFAASPLQLPMALIPMALALMVLMSVALVWYATE